MAKFKKLFQDNTPQDNDNEPKITLNSIEPTDKIEKYELLEPAQSESIPTINEPESINSRYTEEIPVELIKCSKHNPFTVNDGSKQGVEDFETLKNSIRNVGLIHNLVVNKVGNDYYLISGERRLRAVKELNWETVTCTVMEQLDNSVAQEMLYLANLDIRHYTPFEELNYVQQLGELYQQMLSEGKLVGAVRDNIANKLNKSKRQVSKYIFINKNISLLSDNEINELKVGEMSINKAYLIIKERQAISDTSEPETKKQDNEANAIVEPVVKPIEEPIEKPIEKPVEEPVVTVIPSDMDDVVDKISDVEVKKEETYNHTDEVVVDKTELKTTLPIESNNIMDIINNSNGLSRHKARSIDGSFVSGYLFKMDEQYYIIVSSQIKEQDNSKKTTRISITMFPVLDDTIEKIEE